MEQQAGQHQQRHSMASSGSGSLELPFPSTSSFNSLAANAGDHHLFERAFAQAQQDKEVHATQESPVRQQYDHLADVSLASPSSILNAYQRPSIHQAIPYYNHKRAQESYAVQDDVQDWDEDLAVDEHGRNHAFPLAGNDDTIRLPSRNASPVRPPRPPRPNRPVPAKPSLASLNTGSRPVSVVSRTSDGSQSKIEAIQNGLFPANQQVVRPSAPRSDTMLSAAGPPSHEMSSASSASSSYAMNSTLDSHASSSSFPSLVRQGSSASAHFDHLRRRGPTQGSTVPRDSTYTTNTSASDWEREREEAIRDSKSGIFDLEDELEQKFAYPGTQLANATSPSSGSLLELPTHAVVPSPSPTSAGFGLGITSDDAVHPSNPSQPSSAIGSPTVQYASEGYFSAGGSIGPSSAGPSASPMPNSAHSRWGTTRPYLRRNTASSAGRSISRVTSNQSLRGQFASQEPGKGPLPAAEHAPPANLASVTGERRRRRSPSFSAFSTSSNGHAALATLSYAETSAVSSRPSHSRAASMSSVSTGVEELDLDDGSDIAFEASPRPARESARPPSQAVALVESGKSSIIRLQSEQSIDDIATMRNSTHLILSGSSQPVQLRNLLASELHLFSHSLVVLDISNCYLSSISDCLQGCRRLEELNISNNQLAAGVMPAFIATLSQLRMLLADNCGLLSLSQSLAPLQKLHTLAVRSNQIKSLPSWLRHLAKSLENLLVDGNPFYGDHANLVRALYEQPPLSTPPMPQDVQSAVQENAAAGDVMRSALPSPVSSSASPRSSFIARARSYRAGLRRPSILNSETSPIDCLLLADNSPRASTFTQRGPGLRSMRSTCDLNTPQPSIHSLISESSMDLSDLEDELVPKRKASSRAMTVAEFFRSGQADEVAPPVPDAQVGRQYDSAHDASADEAEPEREPRDRKPSFFRKLSMAAKERKAKMDKKRSMSVVKHDQGGADMQSTSRKPSPDKDAARSQLGKGKPRAPFLTEDLRSSSAPAASTSADGSPHAASAAHLPTPPTSPARSLKRNKLSKAPTMMPVRMEAADAPVVDRKKRRSFLTLNMLPEVVSPGPLTLGMSSGFPISPIHEDDTIVISMAKAGAALPEAALPAPPLPRPMEVSDIVQAQRRTALSSIMAYLSDLDDLNEQGEPSSPPPLDLPTSPRSSVGKKASSAAISMLSSMQDPASGEDSPKQPFHGPVALKYKDDPVRRERVINEIIASERSYLAGLQELVELYIQPASVPVRSSSKGDVKDTFIPSSERSIVFSTAESISTFHASVFLPELEKATSSVSANRNSAASLDGQILRQAARDVAQVFSAHAAFLKMYHSYCVNFDTALDRLKVWKSLKSGTSSPMPNYSETAAMLAKASANLSSSQKKRIRELLKSAHKDSRHSQIDLQSYLLLPIQRIPRYKMLLESLLQCTPVEGDVPESDPVIASALESMSQLASEMNERKRDSEGRKRLIYWQSRLGKTFKSPIVQAHRTVLKEGSMVLSRVVKRSSAIVASARPTLEGETSLVQVHSLAVDSDARELLFVICSDLLILMTEVGDGSDTVEPFTVIRLGKALGGKESPASLFGSQHHLRIVDSKAILYLDCGSKEQAESCCDLINKQSRLNEHVLGGAFVSHSRKLETGFRVPFS